MRCEKWFQFSISKARALQLIIIRIIKSNLFLNHHIIHIKACKLMSRKKKSRQWKLDQLSFEPYTLAPPPPSFRLNIRVQLYNNWTVTNWSQ